MFFRSRNETAKEPVQGRAEEALALFREGMNCAQALLLTYGRQLGLDREQALKIGAAFGSGMGMGETCGAVTGALMVLGLRYGKTGAMDCFSKEETYDLSAAFLERFRERNETILCRELLGCDVSTTEGLRLARREKHFKKRCPKFVRDAAEILEEML